MKNFILNIYKPKDMGSFDVVRFFKHRSKEITTKLGHFGTLDPFAEGVLLIGFGQAARLNDYVHELMSKTYLAKGIIGKQTATGDLTSEITQEDNSQYLTDVISKFSVEFIQEKLRAQFLGEYWQAPHKFSASKYQGRKLHEWARDGVDIKKEKKLRHVHNLTVKSFTPPKLEIEFEVSSGTFIRTLFEECCNYLGTIGVLEELIRTKIGPFGFENSIKRDNWPVEKLDLNQFIDKGLIHVDDCLAIEKIKVNEFQTHLIENGQVLDLEKHPNLKGEHKYCFVYSDKDELICLAKRSELKFSATINFQGLS